MRHRNESASGNGNGVTVARSGGNGGLVLVLVLVVALAVVALAFLVGGPGQRSAADAQRVQSQIDASESRATIRQMEADRSHQRILEIFPFAAVAVGGILVTVLLVVVYADLRASRRVVGQDGDQVMLYLHRLELAQRERDRQVWRVLAQLTRDRLPVGEGQVMVYQERGE